MFNWIKRIVPERRTVQAAGYNEDEWITVPFRYAEAVRVSLHTIQAQQHVPPDVRNWIREWLVAYNHFLAGYMQKTYGEKIFPILDEITKSVMPGEEEGVSWDIWERELHEEE